MIINQELPSDFKQLIERETFNCEKHGEVNGYVNPTTKLPICALCIDEQNNNEMLNSQKSRIDHLLNVSSIPKRYKETQFEILDKKERIIAKKIAINYANTLYLNNWSHLEICGSTGTGKTLLACRLAIMLINKGVYVKYTTSANICAEVKANYKEEARHDTISHIIKGIDLLILDEIDTLLNSEHDRGIIHSIIRGRYEQMKPIITISNSDANKLASIIGERAYSALQENNTLLEMEWEDFRKARKNAA